MSATDSALTNETAAARARAVIPGGVNSPVRAFGSVGGTPLSIEALLAVGAIERGCLAFDVCVELGNRLCGSCRCDRRIIAAQ